MAQSNESLRKQIDDVDDEISALISRRIELANLIMQSKPPAQILDSGREKVILERYSQRLATLSTPERLRRLVSAILGASRFYPEF